MKTPPWLRIVAGIVGGSLLLLSGVLAYDALINERADDAARTLCTSVHVGESRSDVVAAATATAGHVINPKGDSITVLFPGFTLEAGLCEISMYGDKVIAAHFEHYEAP